MRGFADPSPQSGRREMVGSPCHTWGDSGPMRSWRLPMKKPETASRRYGLGYPPVDRLRDHLSFSSLILSVWMRCRSKSVVYVIVTVVPAFNPFNFSMKSLSL